MITEVLGIIIILGVLVILLLKRNMSSGIKHDDTYASVENIGMSADNLKKEIINAGDNVLQQMDGRINQLETLIKTADMRVEELKKYSALLAENENSRIFLQTTTMKPSTNFNTALKSADVKLRHIDVLSAEESVAEQQQRIKSDTYEALPAATKVVFSLLDQGMTSSEICRRLSMSGAAVAMIVQMYEKLHSK
jgi:wyosine [tRNA(Phe)-imidazoG37] synthetase (radical SAM superfamily)